MLPRAAAAASARLSVTHFSGAASLSALPRCRLPPKRTLSLLPFTRSKTPTHGPPPVYFARHFSPPRSTAWRGRLGRAAFTTVALYVCFQVFMAAVLDPLLDWADNEWDSMSEKEKAEWEQSADADNAILFLPFPFTTKEVQQPPYKGSDPEWSTFLALSKDQQLQKEIKLGLAEVIRRGVERNPAYVKLLGGSEIKLKKLWLDIIYPPRPPPKHVISGIIIDDDGIFWGDRPLDSLAASRLNMALYPKAVALTVWTFFNFLFRQTAHDIAKALGINAGSPPPDSSWQIVTLNRVQEQDALGGTSRGMTSSAGQTRSQPIPVGTGNATSLPTDADAFLNPRVQAAFHAATLTFAKTWQPVKQPPRRGCIRVDGLVELQGQAAAMAVYVLGWYDPKQRKFMGIQTGLKHLVQHKQRPAGG